MAAAPDYSTVYVPDTAPPEVTVHTTPVSLALVAVTMFLVAAWGGIVPFVGPVFGFSADHASSWVWDLQHAVLALVPGAVGVFAALMLLGRLPLLRRGIGGGGVALAGVIAVLAGGWFVVGPVASRAVLSVGYFASASPFRAVVDQIGYSLGTGLVLVACGAFAVGWSFRQRGVTARLASLPVSSVPVSAVTRPAMVAVPAYPATVPVTPVPPAPMPSETAAAFPGDPAQ